MFAFKRGTEAIDFLATKFDFHTVLDIGAGAGDHARYFRDLGYGVTTINRDIVPGFDNDFIGDYNTTEFPEPFDAIWACHVLEHQQNPGHFLKKVYRDLKPGGIAAITVPPWKPQIVGGHLTLWNAGLLLYNMILAGFDCRRASIKTYAYNVSVIVRKSAALIPADLRMDGGDIEKLAHLFPFSASQGFNGDIDELNWDGRLPDKRPVAGASFDHATLDIKFLKNLPSLFETDMDLLLWAAECRSVQGHVLEFGVFHGRSITAIANLESRQKVVGFDSFEGLPEKWVRSGTSTYERGHFAIQELPAVPPNVQLVRGFFDQSLSPWKDSTDGPISMIHFDADLYSSTIGPLCILNDRIVAGTVLVFDELCDWQESGIYPNWPENEWRALLTWMEQFAREVRPLARGSRFNAAFVVTR